jgi:hypothetical protein
MDAGLGQPMIARNGCFLQPLRSTAGKFCSRRARIRAAYVKFTDSSAARSAPASLSAINVVACSRALADRCADPPEAIAL